MTGKRPPLTVEQVLAWADAHYARTGSWPTANSGPLLDVPGEDWGAINQSLFRGSRGLSGGSSLSRLLAGRDPPAVSRPATPLTVEQVLAWADAHHERTGRWPHPLTGSVTGAPGETWADVNSALMWGLRGLPGGSSLARLLVEYGRKLRPGLRPPRR